MVSTRRRVEGSRAALWDSLFASALVSVEWSAVDPKPCTLVLGSHVLQGVVETFRARSSLAARFASLADALLFIELEGSASSGFHVGFWLSTYGVDEATVADLQQSLDATVAALIEQGTTVAL